MKLSIATNISKLRKAHSMTQEQLAEVLGITFAAVSKWERGVATPDLDLIVEMADLFGVSVDVLIGYELRNNDKDAVIARLKQYVHDRQAEDALTDAEKALQRYPNCFEIVYYSAVNYQIRGIYQREPSYSKKALSLYRHACRLIDQNTDSEISEISIHNKMADVHIALGEYDKGIEILKKNNPCQLNHPLIGSILALSCNTSEEALSYLSEALLDLFASHMRIVIGYINVFQKSHDYRNAIALLEWALSFYPGLKQPDKTNYMEKSEALLWGVRAEMHLHLNEVSEAAECLRQAKTVAERFDADPNYIASNVRFVLLERQATFYDDFGDTALDGLEHLLIECSNDKLSELWEEIKHEK